jgi:hypothetical protein
MTGPPQLHGTVIPRLITVDPPIGMFPTVEPGG